MSDSQTDRQTDRQIDRQTDRQADRQTDRQTDKDRIGMLGRRFEGQSGSKDEGRRRTRGFIRDRFKLREIRGRFGKKQGCDERVIGDRCSGER